ncbi:hypothetical protein PsorP6_010627 [Peronosclerospora sorghi]|uniref:Uncharacterized protein n=1 Tax=Peronosclerospora sorghi TaxID=230839 RepID=A0ACC0VU41_9STRA|nr:hypothetical protein PsorP6_010627 [Peronosclerospora sorghi]
MLLAAQEVAEIQAQSGRGQATGGKGKAKGDDKGAKNSGNGGEASARRCFKCKSTGHIKVNCSKIKKPSAGEGSGGAITKETNIFCSGGHQSTHASGSGVAKVTDGGPMNGQVNHQQPLGSTEHLWYFDSVADTHVTDDDDEKDENACMNYGVDLNDPTVDNDDRAVGAGAQDTGTGVDTNTDDGANNDSANAVNGSVDRDSHASEPSHDSPATAEYGDQVSTEEGNNSVLSGDDAGRASDAGVALRDMPAVDSKSGRDGEPQLHDGESEGEDQQSDGSQSTTGVCGSVCGSMDMDNLGDNQRGVSVEIHGPVATLEPYIDQFMEQARVLKRDGRAARACKKYSYGRSVAPQLAEACYNELRSKIIFSKDLSKYAYEK